MRCIAIIMLLFTCHANAAGPCTGRFVNPITDICWECLFPITIGSLEIVGSSNPDTQNPSLPVCLCNKGGLPTPGIAGGFWEPIRLVDVTKRPYCFPSLGGLKLDLGLGFNLGNGDSSRSTGKGGATWHVHWYIYPLIYWLNLITDFVCLETLDFDVAYLTELDPLWWDDALTGILNPEVALFANPLAQASCALDCTAATAGSAIDSLFWCAGCQGGMYPLNGRIQAHIGSVQSALLAVERMTYKLHREFVESGTSGSTNDQICNKYPMPVMKKTQYRSQLVVPSPSDCYPFGRSTTLYESGKEVPIVGEDFGFLIWRKRNCCIF